MGKAKRKSSGSETGNPGKGQILKLLLASVWQGSKLLGFWISGTPKNDVGNTNLGAGFPTGNPRIARLIEHPYTWIFCQRNLNSEAGFRTETQILIVMSIPVLVYVAAHFIVHTIERHVHKAEQN